MSAQEKPFTQAVPVDANLREGKELTRQPKARELWESTDGKYLVRIDSVKGGTVSVTYRSQNARNERSGLLGGTVVMMDLSEFSEQFHFFSKPEVKRSSGNIYPINQEAPLPESEDDRVASGAAEESDTMMLRQESESARTELSASFSALCTFHGEIVALLQQATSDDTRRELEMENIGLLEQANKVMKEVAEEEHLLAADSITEEYLTRLRAYEQALEAVKNQMFDMKQRIEEALLGADTAGTSGQDVITASSGGTRAKDSRLAGKNNAGAPSDKGKEPTQAGSGGSGDGGGPKGPDDTQEFDRVFREALEQVRQKIESEITALDTPVKYAQYCKQNLLHQDGDKEKIYLISFDEIKEKIDRVLLEKERTHVATRSDKQLIEKLNNKFFELKNAGLRAQKEKWRSQLRQVSDTASEQRLMAEWTNEKAVSPVWSEVLDDLGARERRIIEQDYTERFDAMKDELELLLFRKGFPGVIEGVQSKIKEQRLRFLERVVDVSGLTEAMKDMLWEKNILPVIHDMVIRGIKEKDNRFDADKAEKMFSALIRELNREYVLQEKKRRKLQEQKQN